MTTKTIIYKVRRNVWHVRAIVDGALLERVYIGTRASSALRAFRAHVRRCLLAEVENA